ncbi:hypothetical protein [Chryseobacterium culicis]|uniref:DUF4440 domain-containing protein n=1 Tax=Chryseobacterium culicis TaxID=680127 RepID=A0A1H6H905_CHRCI|nr:hypothetical protein [Chryseobacterium culicis]SEH32279.1 hypothetical protein SAMN05421593_1736 [Chryseobacterium culicis]
MNNTEKIIGEIKEFHRNIEKWFQGKAKNQESLYKDLLSGFSPDFKMINGNGDTITLSMLEEWLPTVSGKFPERNILVENIEVHHSEYHGVATYIETQITGEVTNRRTSSAVFLLNEEKALWLHLIEQWI